MTDAGFIRTANLTPDEVDQAKISVSASYPGAEFWPEVFDPGQGETIIPFTYDGPTS